MSQRLKSWESPRHRGRNNKGKGGAARSRQVKKQQQTLRKLLKAQNTQKNENHGSHFSFLSSVKIVSGLPHAKMFAQLSFLLLRQIGLDQFRGLSF